MNDRLDHFEVTLSGPGTLPTVARAVQHLRTCPEHEVWIALSNHGMGDDHPVLWTCRTCNPGMFPAWRNEADEELITPAPVVEDHRPMRYNVLKASRGENPWEDYPTPPAEPVDGMPGTWSHCGNQRVHGPHRHTVSFNEGPTPNVLCKGTPGDPDGDAPYGRLVYEQ